MNSTLAVALIASLSTLAGGGITGYITFMISRNNNTSQLALADAERAEHRTVAQLQARKDCYVQFLNQISVAENSLDVAWRSNAPSEPQNAPDCIKSVTTELDALTRYTNIVILEGPAHVSLAAQELQARLTLESVNVVKAAKESPGKAPCLRDEKLFTTLHMERARAKSAFIKSAQAAIK
jgi:hypothetical protein